MIWYDLWVSLSISCSHTHSPLSYSIHATSHPFIRLLFKPLKISHNISRVIPTLRGILALMTDKLIISFLKFQHLMFRCILRYTYHFKPPLHHLPHLHPYLYWCMRIILSTARNPTHIHTHARALLACAIQPTLHYTILYYTMLHSTPQHRITLYSSVLSYPVLSWVSYLCRGMQNRTAYSSAVRRG